MYITPEEVTAGVRNLSNQGVVSSELLSNIIDDGASEINNSLAGIYNMPIPDAPEQGEDKYKEARRSLKTLLFYYCMVRLELFMKVKGGSEAEFYQAMSDRKAYRSLYDKKLEALLTLRESLPKIEVKELTNYDFPKSQFNDYDNGPNW